MTIKDRIRTLCKDNGMSIPKLEVELGFGNGTILKWDKSAPSIDKIEKVASKFKVSIDYLLGRTSFKNNYELFEHWGYSPNGFESAFDFGKLLMEERKSQDISIEDVSEALEITMSDVKDIETGNLPINYNLAERYANFLGTSTSQIFFDNDMYEDCVPEEHHDKIDKWEESQKQIGNEAFAESYEPKTIAAHFDGTEYTEEQLDRIKEFAKFIKQEKK